MAETCPNCGETLKIGMISSNQVFTPSMLHVLNMGSASQVEAACNRCGDQPLADARARLSAEMTELRKDIAAFFPLLPIASIHSPDGWQYDVAGIVTAQSVTGTGIFSDVASAFTDLFGTQSGTYNAKLREGENLCKTSLRAQALEAGANAVVAADVDYAEVGGQRAMLMVCMTGTAIRLRNPDRIAPDFGSMTDRAIEQVKRIRKIDAALTKMNSFN